MFDGIKGKPVDTSKFDGAMTGAMGAETTGSLKDAAGYNILAPVATEKQAEQTQSQLERQNALGPVLAAVQTRYQQAKDARTPVDTGWLDCMLQWRGVFTPEEQDSIRRAKERNVYASAIFIKITKTKTTAALGQILDLVLENGEIPIRLEPTPVPEGAEELVYLAPTDFPIEDASPYGYANDGKTLEPGATTKTALGGLYGKMKQFLETRKVLKGASPDPNSMPQLTPAETAAHKMQKMILDQMEEENLQRVLRCVAWECVILGTGVMKGPISYEKVTHSWEKDEETGKNVYAPRKSLMPRSQWVSCWNFYPDPNAITIEDAQYTVEKHLLNNSRLSNLKKYAAFDTDAIDRLLIRGPLPRSQDYWEQQIRDVNNLGLDDRYEVLEYWGYLERDMVEAFMAYTGQELDEGSDQYQVNIWVCDNEVLRLVINPFVPQRIPYYTVPYEEHTQQIWGIAMPENMRDTQILMNSHYRMMVDNLALAGNCIFEVNENFLSPGQDLTMYPGKVIKTQGGPPGQSIFSLSFNNTAQSHMQAYQLAKQTADETTGQPSYSYGGASTTGANRTASGISMVMGAAAGNIRQVVKQFDEYLFRPLGEAYFNWNMQFNDDAEIHGDVNIVAGGTAALMRREVMSQRLLQLIQVTGANPALAPRINWEMVLKEFAKSLNLDPEKFVNDSAAALLAAEIMGRAGGMQPMQGGAQAPGAEAGSPADQTGGGGGTIAPSMASNPDEAASSASV